MADLSKIKLNGTEYNFKDTVARESIPTKTSELTNDSNFAVNSSLAIGYMPNASSIYIPKIPSGVTDNFATYHRALVYVMGDFTPSRTYLYYIGGTSAIVDYYQSKQIKKGIYWFEGRGDGDSYSLTEIITSQTLSTTISSAIGNINSFEVSIVTSLPTENIDTHTIYFMANNLSGDSIYDEYMYINNNWEKIGSTAVDLSGYLQTTDIADWAKAANKPTYTASEVGALPDTTVIPTKIPKTNNPNSNGYILFSSNNTAEDHLSSTHIKRLSWTYSSSSHGDILKISGGQTYDGENFIGQLGLGLGNYTTYLIPNNSEQSINLTLPSTTGTLALTSQIPAAQVNSDWNATSGVAQILNKPTIPDVPSWALATNKPTYTASEVGALSSSATYVSSFNGESGVITYTPPVTSVNGQTGAVTITAASLDAAASSHTHTAIGNSHNPTNRIGRVSADYGSGVTLKHDADQGGSSTLKLYGSNITITTVTDGSAANLKTLTINDGQISGLVSPTTATMAATKQYVDDVVARTSAPMVIEFAYDEELSKYTCSHTYTEICNAIDNNQLIIAKKDNEQFANSYRDYRESGGTRISFQFNNSSMTFTDSSFDGISFTETELSVNSDDTIRTQYHNSPIINNSSSGSSISEETDPIFTASPAANITTEKITSWDAKSDFSGSYNDLSDKPTIPTVPTNISAFTNDSGYLTSFTESDPTVPAWAKAETKPTYTYTEVGAAASSHTHGSITNAGAITSNTALANGDRLVFSDNSDSGLLKRASITIGNSTTQYLANNGTWQTLPTVSVSQTLTSGTEIGSVNNTKLYAPTPYDDTALAARVTALENLEWATYYSGRSNPSSAQGQNGDIYLQY